MRSDTEVTRHLAPPLAGRFASAQNAYERPAESWSGRTQVFGAAQVAPVGGQQNVGHTAYARLDLTLQMRVSGPRVGDPGRHANPQDRSRSACAAAQKKAVEAIPNLIAMLGDEAKTELEKMKEDARKLGLRIS